MEKQIIIIGGGAAGMFCAIIAARNHARVTILEQNEKLGKKLFITGKGRCNLTNACDIDTLLANIVHNPKFLYSAFYGFDNSQTMDFFEKLSLPLKVERGDRVFPKSDHSSDVIAALTKELKRLQVTIVLGTKALKVEMQDGHIIGVRTKQELIHADAVVIATGGNSYPITGSTGDGYRFAKECSIECKEPYPSLVPFETKEEYVKKLQGLSLKNIQITVRNEKKILYEEFGEMLFTHFGVSGPVILSASAILGEQLQKQPVSLFIDLKPALTEEQLDKRILRDFDEAKNKNFSNAVSSLFPSKMIPVMIELSHIDPYKKVHDISKEERIAFARLIKGFPMTITKTRGFEEAIITRGGISVREINPQTMESKKIRGLYCIGEVLDVDALTGGFNLQIAWSTAYLAGMAVSE